MQLCPSKPIVSWEYRKHLLHPTRQISQRSPAHLKCAQITHISLLQGQNHLPQSPFDYPVWTMPCHLLNTVPKVKTEMVVWGQNACHCVRCQASRLPGWRGASAHSPRWALRTRAVLYSASLGWDQNSVWILLNACPFRTIVKLESLKSKPHKSGIVCTVFLDSVSWKVHSLWINLWIQCNLSKKNTKWILGGARLHKLLLKFM